MKVLYIRVSNKIELGKRKQRLRSCNSERLKYKGQACKSLKSLFIYIHKSLCNTVELPYIAAIKKSQKYGGRDLNV